MRTYIVGQQCGARRPAGPGPGSICVASHGHLASPYDDGVSYSHQDAPRLALPYFLRCIRVAPFTLGPDAAYAVGAVKPPEHRRHLALPSLARAPLGSGRMTACPVHAAAPSSGVGVRAGAVWSLSLESLRG